MINVVQQRALDLTTGRFNNLKMLQGLGFKHHVLESVHVLLTFELVGVVLARYNGLLIDNGIFEEGDRHPKALKGEIKVGIPCLLENIRPLILAAKIALKLCAGFDEAPLGPWRHWTKGGNNRRVL